VSRPVQAVVLFLVGAAVLRASLGDLFLRYVKSGLRPFLIVAGGMLIATAVMTLWHHLRGEPDPDEHGPDEHGPDEHGHHHQPPKVAWLLVLPVFGLLLVTPPALGAYAAGRAGSTLSAVSVFRPLPTTDPAPLTVFDYAARAAFDHGRTLGQRRVRLTGFVVAGPRGERYLTRMILTCCAADAGPVKVGLTGRLPADLRPDTWLEVTGGYSPRLARDAINGAPIPYVDVLDAHPVAAPTERYES
jgi:uncharacterized repeat protein (TIGR03943 family)